VSCDCDPEGPQVTHGFGADPPQGGLTCSTPRREAQVEAAIAVPSRVLVTGGGGRIGSAVVRRLLELGCEVVALDRRFAEPSPATIAVTAAATDESAVAGALEGCDGVVHLAAFTAPGAAPDRELFAANVAATFTVLSLAGERSCRRVAVASSINANGLTFNHRRPYPSCYPISETEPPQLSDPYSLSKAVGESAAEACARRWGMSVVSLRLPFTAPADVLARVEAGNRADPLRSVREGWSYLDVDDAAEAFARAIAPRDPGHLACLLAADDTLLPWPTEEALARWAPGIPLSRPLPGRSSAVDSGLARRELGFAPCRPAQVERRPVERGPG
jgi:nucleoside-diphosphate-sugar epimerase